jgi:hypothetical protein
MIFRSKASDEKRIFRPKAYRKKAGYPVKQLPDSYRIRELSYCSVIVVASRV